MEGQLWKVTYRRLYAEGRALERKLRVGDKFVSYLYDPHGCHGCHSTNMHAIRTKGPYVMLRIDGGAYMAAFIDSYELEDLS